MIFNRIIAIFNYIPKFLKLWYFGMLKSENDWLWALV
jgi:hypothetical protein